MRPAEYAVVRSSACYDAKRIVKAAIAALQVGPKGSPEFFRLRRVVDYLQKQATLAESEME